jgi:oligopeptide transport system substrate-binding protein
MNRGTHRLHVVLILALIAVLIAPALTGVKAAGAKVLNINWLQGDIPTLDPALVQDTTSNQIVTEAYYPLVRGLETDLSNVRPGIADKWDVSADGTVYTFHLRKDISWVMWDGKQVVQVKDDKGNPVMVTAHDFEYGIKRTLDPATASTYAYVFTSVIKGAAELNGYTIPVPAGATPDPKATADPAAMKKLKDGVGYKAVDDWTLEVTLTQPAVFALGILALPNAAAQPQAVIEKFADKWTEPGNAVSYGPYVVSEWKHDQSLTLTANPFWPGLDNSPKPKIEQIVGVNIDTGPAFSNYEAGTIDTSAVPTTEIDRVKADPTLSKELVIAPVFCTYYYGFNPYKAPFDNVHMRRALSYAVDRQSVIDNVAKGGQEPARWMSRPGLAAAPTMENSADLGIGFDADKAKAELKAYMDDTKITDVSKIPAISLIINVSEGHAAIAQAITEMWKTTLGIDIQLQQQEWKVFLKSINAGKDAPQLFRLGWCQDYPDANNFLKDTFYSTSGQNNAKWTNKDFDKIVDDAAKESDPAKRLALYKQAEQILVFTDPAIIPIYWYTRVNVTKPYVTRTFSVGSGDERFEKWDINK